MKDPKQVYSEKIFEYLRPSFPQLSEEQVWDKVMIYHVLTEVHPVIIEAMEAHAASQAVLFAQWCSEGMWTKHENGRTREEVQLWYNTYRYEKMAAPLTGEELYEMFLTQTK